MNASVKRILRDRRLHRLAGISVLLLCGLWLAAWKMGVDFASLRADWETSRSWLAGHPWWLFTALVILPAFPFPTSGLLLLTGSIWTNQPLTGCAIAMSAIALNMSWTYQLAAGPGRKVVGRWLEAADVKLPELPANNQVKMTVILRLTPGFPFFLQNYILGFLRVPFRIYLPVSILCDTFLTCGFVLGGAGISSGKIVPAITGVSVLVVVVLAVELYRRKNFGKS